MNLFLNAVSQNGIIILFDDNRKIITSENISIVGNESSTLVNLVEEFLSKNKTKYSEISNIVVVNGPGSFTGIRIISLLVNTLAFTFKQINLTPISFFDLFENFPIIKKSSKRDLFLKKDLNSEIEIILNEDFLNFIEKNDIKKIYGEKFDGIEVIDKINYENILKNIKFQKLKQIEALYIKKPNIS